jgi:hypothetical protein
MSFSVVGARSARRRVEFSNHPSSVWLRECSLLQLQQSPQNACECNRNVVTGLLLHAKLNHFRSLEQQRWNVPWSRKSPVRDHWVPTAPVSSHFRQAICPAHFLAIFQECFMLL